MDAQQSSTLPETILYVCLAVGLLSLLLAALNLAALYGGALATLRAAPREIPEVLGAVRDQLLEERDALRQQARELRQKRQLARDARRAPHPAHAGRPRSSSRNRSGGGGGGNGNNTGGGGGLPPGLGSRSASSSNLRGAATHALTHAEMTLGQHYVAVRDLYRRFRALEQPFVVVVAGSAGSGSVGGGVGVDVRPQRQTGAGPGVRGSGGGASWGLEEELPPAAVKTTTTTTGEKGTASAVGEKAHQQQQQDDLEMQALERPGTPADGGGPAWYRTTGLLTRLLWWQTKPEVQRVADAVQRVSLRRMEREVTSCRLMLRQIRDGGEGPEDLASPLLMYENNGFGSGFFGSGFFGGGNGGPSPLLGTRRRPVGETSNVYESTDESDSSAMAGRFKYRPDVERPPLQDPRMMGRVSEQQQVVGRRRGPNSPPGMWQERAEPPRGFFQDGGGGGYGPGGPPPPRYAGDGGGGWGRQGGGGGQFPRIVEVSSNERPGHHHPPLALDVPRASRSRSRPGFGYDGPHSPYDARR